MLKTLFVLEIFTFLCWLLVMSKNGLRIKLRLIANSMTSQTEQQIITIYISPDILRSKGNQAMKLGHLIKYITWEAFFLKSHTQNVEEKLLPDPFIKNQNCAYLWITYLKHHKLCFYCLSTSKSTKIYWP